MSRVALVTGSNKGIGYAIVQKLHNALKAKNFDVLLTSRNEYLGRKAVKDLKEKGMKVSYHQLDICDDASVQDVANFLKTKYGGLDILVNNAGIHHGPRDANFKEVMQTNFFKTVDVCEALFPLLRPHSRVVHVSSEVGLDTLQVCKKELRELMMNPTSTEDIVAAMKEYVAACKVGTQAENGFPLSAYGMSKLGLAAMTVLQQREFDADKRADLIVNSACPGWVATDLTDHKGPLTPEQGAETPCYLALLPENVSGPKGQFLANLKIMPWNIAAEKRAKVQEQDRN